MLRLENIKKDYEMKKGSVHALKGISLNFRKNEFVAVLGPSGCGKTTLLNILGGLDHYTSGDLFIEGKSTKDFSDHDWDIYRNHRISFIFQSYNLIPHENILENVELALTIAGASKEEKEQRAKLSLDRVGLEGMYKKMPNQLSGGQCQRVAIARALVNEPEILLADEPTGALDSVTSVQIMNLIKEISKERLVIMVTHNPDLAYSYSTRIIKLLDGEVEDDSLPYSREEEIRDVENSLRGYETISDSKLLKEEASKASFGESSQWIRRLANEGFVSKTSDLSETKKRSENEKAKMSWWTAFKLSAKNLWSKARRTAMTIVASSIGIVGVSAVLAVRGGVTGYINGMQDEMLSGNPVRVAEQSFDLSSIASRMTSSQKKNLVKEAAKDGYINVDFMTERLVNSAKEMGSAMIQNDITPDYIDYIDAMPKSYYKAISKSYGIDIMNNIYTDDIINGLGAEPDGKNVFSLSSITAIATDILERKLSTTGYSAYASMISQYSDTFSQSLDNPDYLKSQYDIIQGNIATKEDEIMIVLSSDEEITDFMLTLLGYYSQDDFLNVVYHYNVDDKYPESDPRHYDSHRSEATEKSYHEKKEVALQSLMDKTFTYYPNDTVFAKQSNPIAPFSYSYMENKAWTNGMKFRITGILRPKKGRQYTSLGTGFFYTPAFAKKFRNDNASSELASYMKEAEAKAKSENKEYAGLQSTDMTVSSMGVPMKIRTGIYYTYRYELEGVAYEDNIALVGKSNSMTPLFSAMASMMNPGASSSTSGKSATLTLRNIGAIDLPSNISFYPKSFNDKYLVTDYLSRWNSTDSLTVGEKTIPAESRKEIKYTDNLQVVISMINNIINIVSIALIAFTALSLVVSTVMIAIITYVSVMERIKEIGVIRSLGGRKKDVSHLFNAETFILGISAGVFGILVTYLLQFILNFSIHNSFPAISAIASLSPITAIIIILISVLLTTIAGLIPARSAARKDPVEALRTE